MPYENVASFTIQKLQILDHNGNVDKELEPKLSKDTLKDMFSLMLLSRQFDDICLKLQREGRLGTYAPLRGQEASQIGSAYALRKKDHIFPSYRDHGPLIVHGMPLHDILLYWKGYAIPWKHDQPYSIPVGTQTLHAAGMGWGLHIQNKKEAAIVYFGDGATSQGDFYESLNMASTFHAHTIFFCQNNQYAISVPRKEQTCAETLAQKGLVGCGHALQVDGNDILAVYHATQDALKHAQQGMPCLIEAITFRQGPHTTADEPKRYISKKERDYWDARDPINRFRTYLKNKKIWTKTWENRLLTDHEKTINEAVKKAESQEQTQFEKLFENIYEKPLPHQEKQREQKNTLNI